MTGPPGTARPPAGNVDPWPSTCSRHNCDESKPSEYRAAQPRPWMPQSAPSAAPAPRQTTAAPLASVLTPIPCRTADLLAIRLVNSVGTAWPTSSYRPCSPEQHSRRARSPRPVRRRLRRHPLFGRRYIWLGAVGHVEPRAFHASNECACPPRACGRGSAITNRFQHVGTACGASAVSSRRIPHR